MGLRTVNLLRVELDEPLDEAPFGHVAATVGPRLGADRIGASVYTAEAATPIWPYHYHHGIEEWLYVIAGTPRLREPAGKRRLKAGDLIRFPSGPAGAHTVEGPGRFAIIAAGQLIEPYLSVYPDSDKVSGPEGILLRSSAVGYWHGESASVASQPVALVPEPETAPPRPLVNVLTPGAMATDGGRLEASVLDLERGEVSGPYHHIHGREAWMLVLANTPAVRHPDGESTLSVGDLVCFPEGEAGARQVRNNRASAARVLLMSTTGWPVNVGYPDSGHWEIGNGPGEAAVMVSPTGPQFSPVGHSRPPARGPGGSGSGSGSGSA